MSIPKTGSAGEEELALHLTAHGIPFEREFRFDPKRKWRADFMLDLDRRVLVEVEGGTWMRGRHTRGSGFAADCEKSNRASELGFCLLRYTPEMIHRGEAIDQILHMSKRL